MPHLNPIRAAIDNENRVEDIDSMECAAGQIEHALEKVMAQEKGCTSDVALDAFADAINALQAAAAELRVKAASL